MEIIWKPVIINGQQTQYSVSEYGNVLNTKTNRMLSPYVMKGCGREKVLIYMNGKRMDMKIHRLVYEAFYGPIPKDMTVDHIDENKNNNHYKNLRLLTASENIKSYLANHPEHGFQKMYSDEMIRRYFTKLKNHMYYKDAAINLGLNSEYAYMLLRGARRRDIWKEFAPFPRDAHRKSYLSESDRMVAIAEIIEGLSTREILMHLDVNYDAKGIDAIAKLRSKLGIKDPKYFELSFINDIDALIIAGKTNQEIYSILNIELTQRISDMMARRRKRYNIPNINCKSGDPDEIKKIKKLMLDGKSNSEILSIINKNKSKYYVNLFGRLRQELKKSDHSSSTIEQPR